MAISLQVLSQKARKELCKLVGLDFSSMTGIVKGEGDKGWVVTLEVVERHAIPDSLDLLAEYDFYLNEEGVLQTFVRKGLRSRNSEGVSETCSTS